MMISNWFVQKYFNVLIRLNCTAKPASDYLGVNPGAEVKTNKKDKRVNHSIKVIVAPF